MVPTLLKKFYELDREEGLKKLNEYFRLYEEKNLTEALKVFGIEFETERGIQEIHENYYESLRELSERLGTEIIVFNPNDIIEEEVEDDEDYDNGFEELDEFEDGPQDLTDEEYMETLSEDDGIPQIDDYSIPDDKYSRDDDDEGK